MMDDLKILKQLYDKYTKKYLNKILLSAFFTLLLAGSTSSVA
jgi:subfamily B ATP-binding cassette protein MsbA